MEYFIYLSFSWLLLFNNPSMAYKKNIRNILESPRDIIFSFKVSYMSFSWCSSFLPCDFIIPTTFDLESLLLCNLCMYVCVCKMLLILRLLQNYFASYNFLRKRFKIIRLLRLLKFLLFFVTGWIIGWIHERIWIYRYRWKCPEFRPMNLRTPRNYLNLLNRRDALKVLCFLIRSQYFRLSDEIVEKF